MVFRSDVAGAIQEACIAATRNAIAKGFRPVCLACDGKGIIEDAAQPSWRTCRRCNGVGTVADALNFGERLALIHSEVSELLEVHRKGQEDAPDEHCPEYTRAEMEAADILIRVFDLAGGYRWRLGEAVEAKMRFNATRPVKHGGKRY